MGKTPTLIGLGNVIGRSLSLMTGTIDHSLFIDNAIEKPTGCTIVISGPSGSGKSTLLKRLFQQHPDTTRNPRFGEENGRDYHFVTRSEFETLRDKNAFLEWAEFSKNLYGTSLASVQKVLDNGQICILDIDLQGVHSVKQVGGHLNPRYIFIKPPSFKELKERLVNRSTESPESLELRLKTAQHEVRFAEENPGFHDFVIVNDELDAAYKLLDTFIFGEHQDKKPNF